MPFPCRFGRMASAVLLVIGAIPLIITMVVVTVKSLRRPSSRPPSPVPLRSPGWQE